LVVGELKTYRYWMTSVLVPAADLPGRADALLAGFAGLAPLT
jgi:hypothetical protein